MSEGDSNFFSRWSRRKVETRTGTVVPAPAAPVPAVPAPAVAERAHTPAVLPSPPVAAPPPPTLADVDTLTAQSDYTRFVARDVPPEVKQAALKKLFTDPHFNVMDGLDTYIDDYGQPDPLPPGMLRKMMQSQMLGLFDHEKKADGAPALPGPKDPPALPADTAPQPPDGTAAPDPVEDAATESAPPTTPNPPEA